jgi:LysM repeat protein
VRSIPPHQPHQPLQGDIDVRIRASWLITILLLAVMLAGCTRDRPAPEAAETVELPSQPVTVEADDDNAAELEEDAVIEPEVVQLTPEAEETDGTPGPDPEETPEVFQYIVEPGDTLLSIALDYSTEVEAIRVRNNLFSDEIQVGMPLLIPYVEGVYVPGMPTATPGPYYYTVKTGDTLGSIALQFGVEPLAIVEASNLLDQNSLTIGEELVIPGFQSAVSNEAPVAGGGDTISVSGSSAVHVVQVGESLYGIAEIYGVDANDFALANNVSNWNVLRVGQELIVPGISEQESLKIRGQTHVVQSGESLSEIAVQYDKTVSDLINANGLTDPNAITVGLELVIPE